MNKIYFAFKSFIFFLLLIISNNALAVTCKTGTAWASGVVLDYADILDDVLISTKSVSVGTILWRSQMFNSQFTCYDAGHTGLAENGYLYLDPQKTLTSSIPSSIEIGITLNGEDIPIVANGKHLLGPAVSLPKTNQNCKDIGMTSTTYKCATPQTYTLNYTLYVKSKSASFTEGPIVNTANAYSIFQIDGAGGLNNAANSNFNLYFRGLDKIKLVNCVPSITINGSSDGVVNFGRVSVGSTSSGTTIKKVPFDLNVLMAIKDTTMPNTECANKDLTIKFISTSFYDQNTILPDSRNDVGIQILPSGESTPITLNEDISLGRTDAASMLTTTYDASLVALTSEVKAGDFSATVNLEVSFK